MARPPAIPDRSPGLSRVRFTCQRTPCGGAARSRCTSARCRAPKARRRLRRRPVRRRRRRRDTKRGRPPWSAWVPARCAVRPQAHEKVSPKTHRGTHARSRAVPPRYLVARRRSCRSCTRCTVRDRDPTPPAPPRNATRPGAGGHLGGSRNDGGRTRSVRTKAMLLVGGNGVAGHRAGSGVWEGAWEGRGVDALRATRLGWWVPDAHAEALASRACVMTPAWTPEAIWRQRQDRWERSGLDRCLLPSREPMRRCWRR